MAAEELEDLHRLDAKLKAMKAELKAVVLATGSHLMDIYGIGPAGAARILADVGDVARFPDRHHFASWTGTAPIDASSGQHLRHRLSRAGNRRLNHVLYTAGIVQLRNDTAGRAYYRRKLAAGKTSMEAMRRRGLPAAGRRRPQPGRREPGRAPRGVSYIQRGRPVPGHRHFGSATSRTRTPDATAATIEDTTAHGPRSRCHPAAHPRCQRGAPRRTNDVTPTSAAAPSTAPGPCP
jgi:hypothetical protein